MIIDGHADTIERFLGDPDAFHRRSSQGHLDGPRMRDAGLNVQIMAVYTPPKHADLAALQYALDFIHAYHAVLESPLNSPAIRPVLAPADLDAACLPGAHGFLLFIEGASPLRGNMKNLDAFFRLGVRGITITHNHDNEAARGCLAEGENLGLTAFGRDLVREMQDRGVVVDLAHANERAFLDVVSLARKPVIDSHTVLRRFWDHQRNLTDEQVLAVAKTGGVVCIDFVPDHILDRADRTVTVKIADVVRVIVYAVEKAGIDHVGIGADWDGFPENIEGLEGVTGMSRLRDALSAGGMSDGDIEKIFGQNMLRALKEAMSQ